MLGVGARAEHLALDSMHKLSERHHTGRRSSIHHATTTAAPAESAAAATTTTTTKHGKKKRVEKGPLCHTIKGISRDIP